MSFIAEYTYQDVAKHAQDQWVVISGWVYDLSKFDHPGGIEVIKKVWGKNASQAFYFDAHHGDVNLKALEEFKIGKLKVST